MFDWLKRKKKVEDNSDELIEILVNYIDKAKQLGYSDEDIKKKFKDKRYSKVLIRLAFEIYQVKGGMRMKKHKEKEEEEDDDSELDEEPEDDEEEEKPVKKVKKPYVPEDEVPKPETKLTDEQIRAIISNIDARVTQLEASNYRLRSI